MEPCPILPSFRSRRMPGLLHQWPSPLSASCLQTAGRHFIRYAHLGLRPRHLLDILAALYPARNPRSIPHLELGCMSRVPPPADARYVVGLPIRAVHREQDIRYLPSQGRLPVGRLLAYIAVQEDLVRLPPPSILVPSTKPASLANTESTSRFLLSSWRL